MLVQKLVTEGDPAYEQEIFFTTRRGTRLLNMSDFRDTSRSNSWDYSAFVKTYSLYHDKEEPGSTGDTSSTQTSSPEDLKIHDLFAKMHQLLQLLERFLATKPGSTEADLLHLGDDAPTTAEHGDKLALALFDGALGPTPGPPPPLAWEAFKDSSDWELALVQSASYLPHQNPVLGGGFDTLVLDGMYQQGAANAAVAANSVGGSGSASSVALGSVGNPHLLALPAPLSSSSESGSVNMDPFAASLVIAPPSYVQMSELEKKQRLLAEEQLLWQQYQRNGMQGLHGLQGRPPNMGGYGYRYGQG